MANEEVRTQISLREILATIAARFNLRADQSGFIEIDQNIRDGIELKGTNLWVLMLAIFIASIGLNVNSTAVIIGAMLISPLMGPIMGVGYGVGINDYQLIKKALSNLLLSFLIALFTSTLYFLISPLSIAQSELLARTSPTIWDVLIALFGGLAGIIAATRKEKSNVLPGVAIATALMPPLCTAGYAIANGSIEMFFGAFYLFFINCIFIALSTLLLISYLKPPHKLFVSEKLAYKVKRYIYIVVVATVMPSIYLAYGLVEREVYNFRANEFIKNELTFEKSFIAKQNISLDKKEIDITLVGEKLNDERLAELSGKLERYRLSNTKLNVHQTVVQELDEASLKKTLLADVLSANSVTFGSKDKQIQDLQNEIANLKSQQSQQAANLNAQKNIFNELAALYPQVQSLAIAKTNVYQRDVGRESTMVLASATSKKTLSKDDRRRIAAWLKTKTGADQVRLFVESNK